MKGQEVQIVLKDDNVIFKQPYRYNEVEKTLVQAWMIELLDVSLVELSKGECFDNNDVNQRHFLQSNQMSHVGITIQ